MFHYSISERPTFRRDQKSVDSEQKDNYTLLTNYRTHVMLLEKKLCREEEAARLLEVEHRKKEAEAVKEKTAARARAQRAEEDRLERELSAASDSMVAKARSALKSGDQASMIAAILENQIDIQSNYLYLILIN